MSSRLFLGFPRSFFTASVLVKILKVLQISSILATCPTIVFFFFFPLTIQEVIEEDQFGFRKGKGARDAIGLMIII